MKQKSFRIGVAALALMIVTGIGLIARKSNPEIANKTEKDILTKSSVSAAEEQTQTTAGTIINPTAPLPRLFISGGKEGYSSGGLISLTSTEEPAVDIASYNLSGEASITVYEANLGALLDYLTHTKEGKQTKAKADTNSLRKIATFKHKIDPNQNTSKTILPIGPTGIWYLDITINGLQDRAFIVRSSSGAVVKQGDGTYLFWTQNFKTRRSIPGANITLYNLVNTVKTLDTTTTNSDGLAQTSFNDSADIAVVQNGDDISILPINLRYLNDRYNYKPFQVQKSHSKFFLFTDRPLYRPGDTLYFKSVIRDDYDGAYSSPSGNYRVRIFKDWNESESIFDKTIAAKNGVLTGEFILPQDAATGSYQIKISLPDNRPSDWLSENYVQFRVGYFRKPEYSIDITTGSSELVPGDQVPVTITGSYFFGAPLAGQKVKYSVYASDYYDYGYWDDTQSAIPDDYRYGYWNGIKTSEQELTLNDRGEAIITLDTKPTDGEHKTKVYSLEAETIDQSGNPAFSRKNVIVYAGEYGIYREGYTSNSTPGTPLTLPVVLKAHRTTNLENIPITAKITRRQWISYLEPGAMFPSYREETEDLSPITAKTDSTGKVLLSITPKKSGSYTWVVEGKDSKGNTVRNEFYTWVSSELDPYYSFDGQNGNLSLKLEKAQYKPGEPAVISINSTIPNRDILLTLQRNFVHRYQVVRMSGKNARVTLPTSTNDIPNIIAVANSFGSGQFDRGSQDIPISAAQKKLQINLTPDKTHYGPGEIVTVNIDTKTGTGTPISAEVAVWAVDKSIFELADNNLGDIYSTYWSSRYDQTPENNSLLGIITEGGAEQGGCFAAGTKITMADGSIKNIEDIKIGDRVLSKDQYKTSEIPTSQRVTAVHETTVGGYIIINGGIKVTPNHIVYTNNTWQQAGNIQIGDTLLSKDNTLIPVKSVEWQAGKFSVYNLTIANTHTFFAEGILAHNDKGGAGGRSVFKDTAYWNPKVVTNDQGQGRITFKLPDNLTTWVVAGVGQTNDTVVGQTEREITVNKDVVVRPILPNILRVGDQLKLSALIHNFSTADHEFKVTLGFDAGQIASTEQVITIKSKDFQQVYWDIKPEKANSAAKITISAIARDSESITDIITQTIPVKALGFTDTATQTGTTSKTYEVHIAKDTDPSQTTARLSLSPSLLGTLPEAMKYLIDYPYGCVEQTTSRFVPAVIARKYQTLFPEALKDKNTDEIITQGLNRLAELQQAQGGWQWWSNGESNYFITAYVIEYLLEAQKLGFKVNAQTLARAQGFLESEPLPTPPQEPGIIPLEQTTNKAAINKVARGYALSLLGSKVSKVPLTDLNNLTPDIVAMAALANNKNGFAEARDKALEVLRSQKKTAGETTFWDAGQGIYFGSTDSSTAWAIRALLLSKKDGDLINTSIRYLTNNRKTSFWSNTFATAQVIRAVSDATNTTNTGDASRKFSIRANGQIIKTGSFNKLTDSLTIDLPTELIKTNNALTIEVASDSEKPLYSTLTVNQFRTDMKAAQTDQGLHISREYTNTKGDGVRIGVGDIVTVTLRVSGLSSTENYGILEDWLPSGLIPINQSLKNEQYTEGNNGYQGYTYWGNTVQITENGAIIPLYDVPSGVSEYTYQARAVAEGTFAAPPAFAALMYHPEIFSRSSSDSLTIIRKSETPTGITGILTNTYELTTTGKVVATVAIIAVASGVYIFRKRRKETEIKKQDNENSQ